MPNWPASQEALCTVVGVVDPLSFPALAGAALNQAFNFLFGRLASLLDKRGGGEDEESIDPPPVFAGESAPLVSSEDLVEQALPQLRELMGVLSTYDRNPDKLDINDEELRASLGRLRILLEQIYGRPLKFEGEEDRSDINAKLKVKSAMGEIVGIDAKRVHRGSSELDVEQVHRGSSIIGIRADEIG